MEINLQSLIISDLIHGKKSTADTLFNDIYSAMKENKEYRLGSLILHRDENGFYNIVDGQQRLITISLILKALGDKSDFLLGNEVKSVSFKNIAVPFENYLYIA